jgi:multidrug transporter EmrE-like cation transporter
MRPSEKHLPSGAIEWVGQRMRCMRSPGIKTGRVVVVRQWPEPIFRVKFFFLVLGYAASMAGSNLLFKMAASKSGTEWWLWFLAGNVAGFGCPVLITYALREESPQLVYAFTLGSGFVLLQLAAWWWFKAPVTAMQLGGLALTGVGLVMLQLGRA